MRRWDSKWSIAAFTFESGFDENELDIRPIKLNSMEMVGILIAAITSR